MKIMYNWLTSFNPKVHQRKINRCVRDMNKNIERDTLWQGRFYIRQINTTKFRIYGDKSGADLYVQFRVYDKKTGKFYDTPYAAVNTWTFLNGWHVFEIMNNFINKAEQELWIK